jgi:hypothetical protein
MTMFSIKPKFNLAEFLAVPAPVSASRRRGAKRQGMQFQPRSTSEDATKPTPITDPKTTDEQK